MWIEFLRFLRNTSRTFCPTDILSIPHTNQKQNTHTHTNTHVNTQTLSLYGQRTQHVFLWIFNVIRYDNRHNKTTHYWTSLLHQFTRKSNRYDCRMHQTPRIAPGSIPLLTYDHVSLRLSHCPPCINYLCLTSSHKHGTFQTELKL